MPVSITKIELNSYTKLPSFLKMNGNIFQQLKKSSCIKYKAIGSWNLKTWYTMSVWNNDEDINQFYRNGIHLEAMKSAKNFSSNISSIRIEEKEYIEWKLAKELLKKK
ncbi:MAG TPA: hypothetical protein PLG57_11210 [Bacteroidia bacterium]|jgi:hypothetical protein|nr:hypothetical protein [Bacteroidia bacterium]HQF28633.1 hypothetical protein [Bacteroidia bacterium]HQK98124.1 hypothetical protein [Bacteroidia bacterium]